VCVHGACVYVCVCVECVYDVCVGGGVCSCVLALV